MPPVRRSRRPPLTWRQLNVLIDDAGAVKLADFGLTRRSRFCSSRTSADPGDAGIKSVVTTSAAAPQSAFGSPRWMAPERLLGGQLDCPVDVYALAITFYEVFTMETPLGAVDDSRLIELVCDRHVRPARPRTFANGLDEELWRLMEEAWAPRPEARPSALAIAERTAALAARFSTGQDWRVDDWRSIPQKDGAMTMPTPRTPSLSSRGMTFNDQEPLPQMLSDRPMTPHRSTATRPTGATRPTSTATARASPSDPILG